MLTEIGLSDVHMDPIDLVPQWFPQSWELTATSGARTLRLETAQPAYTTPGTSAAGVDLEIIYAGLGSEADLAGRDLHGKAVLLFSNPMPGSWRHTSTQEALTSDDGTRTTWLQLAERRGAAAIICSIQLPGNIRTQLDPTGTRVPTFSLGMREGLDLRDMIGRAPAGQPVHLKLRMDVKQETGLETGTVWGTLKGATDETIYVEAHRDGWFEAGTDNASGVATLLGIAEYFAKVPDLRGAREQRAGRRSEPPGAVRSIRSSLELQHVLPLRRRNAIDGAGPGARGDDACLREDYRGSERTGADGRSVAGTVTVERTPTAIVGS